MMTTRLLGEMKKKWYVWEMAQGKDRIKPETKRRMRIEFENSVIKLAEDIKMNRELIRRGHYD